MLRRPRSSAELTRLHATHRQRRWRRRSCARVDFQHARISSGLARGLRARRDTGRGIARGSAPLHAGRPAGASRLAAARGASRPAAFRRRCRRCAQLAERSAACQDDDAIACAGRPRRHAARATHRELERLAHVAASSRAWNTNSSTTRPGTCCRSATTSTIVASIPASTTCSRPKRGLCSFVAIAQGQLPQETWFALGRLLTEVDGDRDAAVVERLDVRVPDAAAGDAQLSRARLLDQTAKASVERQIEYGRQRGVPWGISECGYNIVDARMNYQYRAFGVPGLGLQRGLAQDLVIAPYASMMALMVAPEAACANLQRLTDAGLRRPLRLVRGDRLHAGAPAARTGPRVDAIVHGAPPGHGPAVAGLPAARPADAEAFRRQS